MFNFASLFNQALAGLVFFGNNILIPILFTVALIPFIYGLFNYLILGPGDEGKKEQGRKQILQANVGLVIAVLVGIVFWFITWINSSIMDFNNRELPPNQESKFKLDKKIQTIPDAPLTN